MHPFADEPWPNTLDLVVTVAFLAGVVLIPAAGYFFMLCDFRAYLRSLRRQVICVSQYLWHMPDWAVALETPRAIAAFGLRLPCTEDDLKHAYRERVKYLHPDHGGDERRFLKMQAQFEEGLQFLHEHPPAHFPHGQHAA